MAKPESLCRSDHRAPESAGGTRSGRAELNVLLRKHLIRARPLGIEDRMAEQVREEGNWRQLRCAWSGRSSGGNGIHPVAYVGFTCSLDVRFNVFVMLMVGGREL